MKQYILIFLIILIIPLTVSAQSLYSPEVQKIVKRGKLVVAMYYGEYVPFFVKDKHGKLYGIDVKIASELAAYLGVKVEFNRKARTFDEIVNMVARGDADIAVSYLSRTIERGKKVSFSMPYIILHPTLLVNRLKLLRLEPGENPGKYLHSPDALIGVERGSSYVAFARDMFPEARVVQYNSFKNVR